MQTTAIIILAFLLIAAAIYILLTHTKHRAAQSTLTTDRDRLAADLESTRTELTDKATQLDTTLSRLHDLQLEHTQLSANHTALTDTLQKLEASAKQQEERLQNTFAKLAADQLDQTQKRFLETADRRFEDQRKANKSDVEQLVKPIADTLKRTDDQLTRIETTRAESFAKLTQHIADISSINTQLRTETARLTDALRKPHVRGRYGEIQLKRVAELAGMIDHCDFAEQPTFTSSDNQPSRPDMVVNLPAGRTIAIDAKTNIDAYIEATNHSDPADAEHHLQRFARHVADQATSLARKNYWQQLPRSPDFVVMFIPGDQFIDAALQRRPDLLEKSAQQGVILASPSTLIGLLRAVAVGWREATIAEEAKVLFELGKELHDRAAVAFSHASSLGKAINASVERYNKLVGSIDSRLLPTLRKFEESGVTSGKPISELPDVTIRPRALETAIESQTNE